MGSLIEELRRREAAAWAEADRLRSRIEELAGELARAEEQASRLAIAREEVTRVLDVAADAGRPLPAGEFAAVAGLSADKAKVEGLLRTAAVGLLPADLLGRRKSIYPGAADQAYERAIDVQLRDLLRQPHAPLFDLIDRERLAAAYARDPRLPGFMAIQPSSTAPVGFLLDVNRWLARSGVTIR